MDTFPFWVNSVRQTPPSAKITESYPPYSGAWPYVLGFESYMKGALARAEKLANDELSLRKFARKLRDTKLSSIDISKRKISSTFKRACPPPNAEPNLRFRFTYLLNLNAECAFGSVPNGEGDLIQLKEGVKNSRLGPATSCSIYTVRAIFQMSIEHLGDTRSLHFE
ncbi:hypothetical protein C8R45DRAFT_927673 [Mycena sanguinolenta]|nr:hypothetical protein C8R45DRAFT_927673 [Mycena sanguinolenta]